MWFVVLSLALIAYVPGALIFRAPIAERVRRAGLAAEERAFWAVMISVAISTAVVLALAGMELYSFRALLAIDGLIAIALLLAWRTKLLFRGTAPWPTVTALIPLALVLAGLWLYVPPAEYIMGGKDPGSYMNEGIQIAQRGSLVIHDASVASLPAAFRDLFFPSYHNAFYFSSRFMGFFLLDPESGTVLGQFPHLLPAWIAIGYGVDGLTGTRLVSSVAALLGLLAIYFAGARLFGRAAATAGTALLAINVIQVWFGRYPNAEMVMQALLFAALAAWSRAHVDDDPFFAPVAATLLGLLLFLRFDSVLAFGGVAVAAALSLAAGRRLRASFVVTLAISLLFAGWYLFGLMQPYMEYPIGFIRNLAIWQMLLLIAGAIALVGFAWGASRLTIVRRLEAWLPQAITVVVLALATYAYFFRAEGGRTALHDAIALRSFAWYVTPVGLVAALVGYAVAMRTTFRRDPALLATVTIFGLFFFYKIKIVPEHFWMARRFLPVILPGAMLLIGYAAFAGLGPRQNRSNRQSGISERAPSAPDPAPWLTRRTIWRGAIGILFVGLLGLQFWQASRPLMTHVEYAGLIPKLEALAKHFGDRDLVVVESRAAGSELHVLALPLAYVYARNVLVLNTPRPDPIVFREFLRWARTQYEQIYFLGGGGTDLLTRTIGIESVTSARFHVPQWESPVNALPRGVGRKAFDLSVYRFVDAVAANGNGAVLDIGSQDDVNVVRFHMKERDGRGVTYRWTQDASYVSLVGVRPESRSLVLVMNDGHRPRNLPPARVEVSLDDQLLGYVDVGREFQPYTVAIPPAIAEAAAARDTPARLKLATSVWNPRDALGSTDDRRLGVMLDRVEVR
jgi:hypothetical protein